MTDLYWQVQETAYLEAELYVEGSSLPFRPPPLWSMTDDPIQSYYRPLVIRAGRPYIRPPDFFYYNVLPFVSDRCRQLLETHGGFSGEFHRATLVTNTGTSAETNPYWYLRLFDTVNAVDRQQSEIEFLPGTERPKRVWRLRLIESELRGHDMFRLPKIDGIFVSNVLKSAAVSAGLNLAFSPAEEFRLGW
jgi:hypothetical protein